MKYIHVRFFLCSWMTEIEMRMKFKFFSSHFVSSSSAENNIFSQTLSTDEKLFLFYIRRYNIILQLGHCFMTSLHSGKAVVLVLLCFSLCSCSVRCRCTASSLRLSPLQSDLSTAHFNVAFFLFPFLFHNHLYQSPLLLLSVNIIRERVWSKNPLSCLRKWLWNNMEK